jgi:hypothetical protein
VGRSPETGSIATACLARSSSPLSPTTQSHSNGDFPAFGEDRRIDGLARGALGLCEWRHRLPREISAPSSLASKFRFPATETAPSRDWFECGAATGNGGEFGVARAIRRASRRGEYALRQPPVDRRLDEVRCKESKRDCHIHFSDTAPLPFGDACRSRCCIEPMASTGDRCNQCCESFGTERIDP